ncbi:MAG: serine/threonine-protein kinase [Gammaproteobacteria bacterium]|nr:serine/threonine-protein kinase [Gammaproteobacteria bacterium]
MANQDDDRTLLAPRDRGQHLHAPNLGTVIKDCFVLESIIGKGGMGMVYRAKDLRMEETQDRDPYVALKILKDEFQRDTQMVVALQREARKAQTLAHPNIATVYDFDRDDQLVYLTMEALDGDPLDQVIAANTDGLPKSQALPIIRGLSLGLAYAHNNNIIHSDFKPANVFLTDDEHTKILDFGIARAAPTGQVEASETDDFDAGTLGALTPSYAACEMFEGADPHAADDVYALAIIAYQLLSGRHPFDNVPAPEARRRKLEPVPLKGLKRREWHALKKGLAFARSDRSQHAAEFLREFEGGSKLRMALGAIAAIAAAFVAYISYVQFEEVQRTAPDIPFVELPEAAQLDFARYLEEGDLLLQFRDINSSLSLYLQAYQLHPRNGEAVLRLEAFFEELTDKTIDAGNLLRTEELYENLEAVMATDDFLGHLPSLVKLQARLKDATGK